MDAETEIITLASAASTSLGLIVVALINYYSSRRAIEAAANASKAATEAQHATEKASLDNRISTEKAAVDALKAREQVAIAEMHASQAAATLIETARSSAIKLDHIAETGEKVHTIVNSQTTVLLRSLAAALGRIATDNPTDAMAQEHAQDALKNLDAKLNADNTAGSPERAKSPDLQT